MIIYLCVEICPDASASGLISRLYIASMPRFLIT